MSVDQITPEDTIKIAGILEQKVTQAYTDKNKWKAEAESLRTSVDVMTADRDYWRHRCEASERDRDEARESEEYMHRQWQSIGAIARETLNHRVNKLQEKVTNEPLHALDKPPSVVVFNRNA